MTRAAVLLIDAEGRVELANSEARAMLGPVEGHLCHEVVAMEEHQGHTRCAAACPASRLRQDDPAMVQVGSTTAGPARVECTPMGRCTSVVILPSPVATPPTAELTPREREVLGLVAEGFTDAQLAKILDMKPDTARSHVKNLRRKLGAASRAEAVARAMAMGLLETAATTAADRKHR